jgi:hypothetical protein
METQDYKMELTEVPEVVEVALTLGLQPYPEELEQLVKVSMVELVTEFKTTPAEVVVPVKLGLVEAQTTAPVVPVVTGWSFQIGLLLLQPEILDSMPAVAVAEVEATTAHPEPVEQRTEMDRQTPEPVQVVIQTHPETVVLA